MSDQTAEFLLSDTFEAMQVDGAAPAVDAADPNPNEDISPGSNNEADIIADEEDDFGGSVSTSSLVLVDVDAMETIFDGQIDESLIGSAVHPHVFFDPEHHCTELGKIPSELLSVFGKLDECQYAAYLVVSNCRLASSSWLELYFVAFGEAVLSAFEILGGVLQHQYFPADDTKAADFRLSMRKAAIRCYPVLNYYLKKLHVAATKKAADIVQLWNGTTVWCTSQHQNSTTFQIYVLEKGKMSAEQLCTDINSGLRAAVASVTYYCHRFFGSTAQIEVLDLVPYYTLIPEARVHNLYGYPFPCIGLAYNMQGTMLRSWRTYGHLCTLLDEMVTNNSHPSKFRWFLNWFITFARSLTLKMQAELKRAVGFSVWWETERAKMQADPTMSKFCSARNLVVHEKQLQMDSYGFMGQFKYHKGAIILKAQVGGVFPVSPMFPNTVLDALSDAHQFLFTDMEQFRGCFRYWRCTTIGEGEITSTCHYVLRYLFAVLARASSIYASETAFPDKLTILPAPPGPGISLFYPSRQEIDHFELGIETKGLGTVYSTEYNNDLVNSIVESQQG